MNLDSVGWFADFGTVQYKYDTIHILRTSCHEIICKTSPKWSRDPELHDSAYWRLSVFHFMIRLLMGLHRGLWYMSEFGGRTGEWNLAWRAEPLIPVSQQMKFHWQRNVTPPLVACEVGCIVLTSIQLSGKVHPWCYAKLHPSPLSRTLSPPDLEKREVARLYVTIWPQRVTKRRCFSFVKDTQHASWMELQSHHACSTSHKKCKEIPEKAPLVLWIQNTVDYVEHSMMYREIQNLGDHLYASVSVSLCRGVSVCVYICVWYYTGADPGGLAGTCPPRPNKIGLTDTRNRPKITVPPFQFVCPPPQTTPSGSAPVIRV